MKRNWRIPIGVAALLLAALIAINPMHFVRGQTDTFTYLPAVERYDTPTPTATPISYFFDDFEDLIPEWVVGAIKEPWTCGPEGGGDCGDGFFEHEGGKLLAHIRDNAAGIAVTPLWRTNGDFKLGVNARFISEWTVEQRLKSYNSLGLVFGANENFTKFYAFLLGDGGAQHVYALVHVDVIPDENSDRSQFKFDNIYGWRGAPNFVKSWSSKNRLEVVHQDDHYELYINDKILPGCDDLRDSRLGDGYVGLMVTSYEFSEGEMQFDNFELTMLYD